jgi:hypothetical protein
MPDKKTPDKAAADAAITQVLPIEPAPQDVAAPASTTPAPTPAQRRWVLPVVIAVVVVLVAGLGLSFAFGIHRMLRGHGFRRGWEAGAPMRPGFPGEGRWHDGHGRHGFRGQGGPRYLMPRGFPGSQGSTGTTTQSANPTY